MGYFWWTGRTHQVISDSLMTTTSATPGGHTAPISLMSCVRESSPQDLIPQSDIDIEKNEPSKKRRFHPFRGLRKMFRRKVRHSGSDDTTPDTGAETDTTVHSKDSHRSRSTSELLAGDEPARRKSGTAIYPGLSVSHDSVFTADQHSTHSSSDLELDTAQSSSSLSIQQLMLPGVRAELLDVVRRRRGRGDTSEDDEDLGLPRSPCNSPTTTDKALKDHPAKSHSTCSDGSLLSMGSSEMDEDSFGPHSRNSSKLSLHDRSGRPIQNQTTDSDEFGPGTISAPLSHSAARHKMAVKPKRTHGAPRRRRPQPLTAPSALPITLEVNEEVSVRSLTPESSATRESMAELYSTSSTSMSKVWNASSVSETHLKSASLPPGLALPSSANKLNRSRSNAGTKGSRDTFVEEDEEEKASKEDKKKEDSFFGRFLARRSGKKSKKSKSEDVPIMKTTEVISTYKQVEERRTNSVDSGLMRSNVVLPPRSGPAARQRIQPIDIPASPDTYRHNRPHNMDIDIPLPPAKSSPDPPTFFEPSPPKKNNFFLSRQSKITTDNQMEVDENLDATSTSPVQLLPPKPTWPESFLEHKQEEKNRVKITGLSTYQQRVLSYDDFDSNSGYKSLSETYEDSNNVSKYSVTKSHSFRSSKSLLNSTTQDFPSLSFVTNNETVESNFSNSYCSKTIISSENNDKKNTTIILTQPEAENKIENEEEYNQPFSIITLAEPPELEKQEEQTLENNDVTISCVNSQVQSSVNTQSSNQVTVVNINNVEEPMDTSEIITETQQEPSSQVSITRVQLKKDSKTVEGCEPVPEFLKIQLHKVADVKSSTNLVLSTTTTSTESTVEENQLKSQIKHSKNLIDVIKSPVFSNAISEIGIEEEKQNKHLKNFTENESEKDNVETVIDIAKRKFSKDDVEIVDKDSCEEFSKTIVLEEIGNNNATKKQNSFVTTISDRKSSLVMSTPAKPFLKIKSNSVELTESNVKTLLESSEKMTVSTEQLSSKMDVLKDKTASAGDVQDSSDPIILRRKSSASQKRDKDSSDEPELMKVFARRSLKLKDSEAETLSQQVMVLVENSQTEMSENNNSANRSRDSDKENEFNESPQEERKRSFQSHATLKEMAKPLTESKYVESSEVVLRKPTNNKIPAFATPKYQKTASVPPATVNDNLTQETRKHKSFFEQKTDLKPKIFEKNINRSRIMTFNKDIDVKKSSDLTNNKCLLNNKNNDEVITNVALKTNEFENEDYVPMFKRIQQRKEEWEQRAQQAMKKTVP